MAKRRSIHFAGYGHVNPIPNASRIGNVVMSSVIGPSDFGTREIPASLEAQVKNVFLHLRNAIAAAGGTAEDILKVEFWVKDPATQREALNAEWVALFPDPDSRPARHTQPLPADSRALVQCAFTAVIG